MNSIEEIRRTVIAEFKRVHDLHYPTMLVNWPNFTSVDTEHLIAPFIAIEISLGQSVDLAGVGEEEVTVSGRIMISHLTKMGVGMQGAATYMDMLVAELCFKRLNGVTYRNLSMFNVSPAPGIVGVEGQIRFFV